MLTINLLPPEVLPPEEILTLEEMHKNHPCHASRMRAHAILLRGGGGGIEDYRGRELTVEHCFIGRGILMSSYLSRMTMDLSWRRLPVSLIFADKRRQHGYMLGKTTAFVRYLISHAVVVRLFCARKQKLMRLHVSINRQDH